MASRYKFTEDNLNEMIYNEVSDAKAKPSIKGFMSKAGLKNRADITNPKLPPMPKPQFGSAAMQGITNTEGV